MQEPRNVLLGGINKFVFNCQGIRRDEKINCNTVEYSAWIGTVRNCKFFNCGQNIAWPGYGDGAGNVAVSFRSYWGPGNGMTQYNNQFINNTVVGGSVFVGQQGGFLWQGNQLKNSAVTWQP